MTTSISEGLISEMLSNEGHFLRGDKIALSHHLDKLGKTGDEIEYYRGVVDVVLSSGIAVSYDDFINNIKGEEINIRIQKLKDSLNNHEGNIRMTFQAEYLDIEILIKEYETEGGKVDLFKGQLESYKEKIFLGPIEYSLESLDSLVENSSGICKSGVYIERFKIFIDYMKNAGFDISKYNLERIEIKMQMKSVLDNVIGMRHSNFLGVVGIKSIGLKELLGGEENIFTQAGEETLKIYRENIGTENRRLAGFYEKLEDYINELKGEFSNYKI